MVFKEPGSFEVWLTKLATAIVAKSLYKEFVDRIGLSGDERVMDYGSGAGMGSRYIAMSLSKGGHLTCVDISKNWMEVAKKRTRDFSNVDYRLGRLRELDIPDSSYDVIVVSFVLHDVEPEERPAMVRELVRKMKPGGRIFLREPTGKQHGMRIEQVRELMSDAGMREARSLVGKKLFEATYVPSKAS